MPALGARRIGPYPAPVSARWEGSPRRHSGARSSPRGLPSRQNPSVPLMRPGARLLTRMFWGPHSTAKCRVIASAQKEGGREEGGRAALLSGVAWVGVRAQGRGRTSPQPTAVLSFTRIQWASGDRLERDPTGARSGRPEGAPVPTAALAEPACTCSTCPRVPRVAVMFTITPPWSCNTGGAE